MRTIKSDVVVGLGEGGEAISERLDKDEPGWKISGKYVSLPPFVFSPWGGSHYSSNEQAVVSFSEGRPGEVVEFA